MAKWNCKDGREIEVAEMATSHIENALAMLKSKGCVGPSTVSFYLNGPMPRGDFATEAYLEEFDRVLESPVSSFVDIFEAELKRRSSPPC